MHILIVDDNTNSLKSLSVVLSDLGHTPMAFTSPTEALKEARSAHYPLIITDIRMPEMSGIDFLQVIKSDPALSQSDVVLITGHGDMETAVGALRSGAYDYLNKPINARELSAVVERSAEHQALLQENALLRNNMEEQVNEATHAIRQDLKTAQKRLQELEGVGKIVAASPSMHALMDMARIFHEDPTVPVMVEGETGTGKEIFARLIHFGDGGNEAPFIPINCSAIPADLFESELFGHEAGAYTGSRATGAPGKLELAGDGTLFLDEVAELPLMLQPKLLRVLEERLFFRVGGIKKREFRARVICAANRKLEEMVELGQFRRDLYHRLKVGHLNIPPLRERPEDIPALANLFLQRQAAKKRKQFQGFSQEALCLLQQQFWAGNVRELENSIERAVLVHDDEYLQAHHLNFLTPGSPGACSPSSHTTVPAMSALPSRRSNQSDSQYTSPAASASTTPFAGTHSKEPVRSMLRSFAHTKTVPLDLENLELPESPLDLDALTTAIVHKALARFNGNKSQAAAYLGISRYALHRRLQKE